MSISIAQKTNVGTYSCAAVQAPSVHCILM